MVLPWDIEPGIDTRCNIPNFKNFIGCNFQYSSPATYNFRSFLFSKISEESEKSVSVTIIHLVMRNSHYSNLPTESRSHKSATFHEFRLILTQLACMCEGKTLETCKQGVRPAPSLPATRIWLAKQILASLICYLKLCFSCLIAFTNGNCWESGNPTLSDTRLYID